MCNDCTIGSCLDLQFNMWVDMKRFSVEECLAFEDILYRLSSWQAHKTDEIPVYARTKVCVMLLSGEIVNDMPARKIPWSKVCAWRYSTHAY
jgi:hypothetical protein